MTIDWTKKFCILGLGISGLATLEILLEKGASQIFISEENPLEKLNEKTQIQIEAHLGSYPSLKAEFGIPHSEKCLKCDYLIVSPGISIDLPLLQKARQIGLVVLPEIELATNIIRDKSRYIGITGTNGKSTTTAWTAHIMGAPACGNIGVPFVKAIKDHPKSAWYICELSSYQLAHSHELKPNIALITNITPDHINWHGSFEKYLQAKEKIAAFQTSEDWLIIPDSEPLNKIQTKSQILWINSSDQGKISKKENLIFINSAQEIVIRLKGTEENICFTQELPLPGAHNIENAMFALGAAKLAGFQPDFMKEKLLSFRGLAHRIEFVGEKKGKKYFNDSKATNPESTIVALKAFNESIIWLAGGRDKMTDLSEMIAIAKERVSSIILYGEAAARFSGELKRHNYAGNLETVTNLEMAIEKASQKKEGKIVLLSPACASFDQFKSFEERGDKFRELVEALN